MIDFANALYAGVVAGSVIAILFAIGRSGGLAAHSELMLGTLVVRSPTLAWLTGATMCVVTFGFVGILYATGFQYLTRRTGLAAGVGLAIVHTLISGLALAALPAVHPLMRARISSEPGIFKSNLGTLDACAFVALHLLYGALVGLLYDPNVRSLWVASQ
jgi:hypothetical protein